MYVELPAVTVTPAERLQALKDAKQLMSGHESSGAFGSMFSSKAAPGASADAIDGFIRLAEYITTGHDYRDTHPEGKRRPVIQKNTTVHVHAADTVDPADLEHLISHIEDGSFLEYLEDQVRTPRDEDTAPDEEKGSEDKFTKGLWRSPETDDKE